MARFSVNATEQIKAVSGTAPVILLEISHVSLPQPIRVVNDNQDLVHNGNTFQKCAFSVTLPSDKEQGMPKARLSIDNLGREMTAWLDASGGGQGALVRFIQVMRNAPDFVEWETSLELTNVSQSPIEVVGSLAYKDIYNLPAVGINHRSDVSPGLY